MDKPSLTQEHDTSKRTGMVVVTAVPLADLSINNCYRKENTKNVSDGTCQTDIDILYRLSFHTIFINNCYKATWIVVYFGLVNFRCKNLSLCYAMMSPHMVTY